MIFKKHFLVSLILSTFLCTALSYADEQKPESHSKWEYRESKDEMRNIVSKFASLESENEVDFDFPYSGGSRLKIVIRKKNEKVDAVLFSISRGQILCGLYDCKGAVRFDKDGKQGSVTNITLNPPESHDSEVVFVANEKQFIDKLKKYDTLIIEIPFYNSGRHQFKFNIQGLNF